MKEKYVAFNGRKSKLTWICGSVVFREKSISTDGRDSRGIFVSTTTITSTEHDDLILVDENNIQHSARLENFKVICKQDDLMTLISAQNGKEKDMKFIAALNHSSHRYFYNKKVFSTLFINHWSWRVGLGMCILNVILGTQIGISILVGILVMCGMFFYQSLIVAPPGIKKFFDNLNWNEFK